MLSRAQHNFQHNWTGIILAVISIIQGLAFNDLAGRLHTILDYTLETHDLVPAAHFLLAFTLLLRIFQTYVTAALDYDEWATNFPDVLLIFIIGLLEYHVFSSLAVPGFNVAQFHKRISIVSVLALIGYIRAFASLQEPMFTTYEIYRTERRLQAVNIGGVFAVQTISLVILLTHSLPSAACALAGIVAAAVLAFNIHYSLRVTFSLRPSATAICDNTSNAAGTPPRHSTSGIEVRQALRVDVLALARLMSNRFGYMFSAVFDTSPRMTEKILLSLLRTANGRIPDFGFRSFQVACGGDPPEVLGLLKVTYSQPINAAMAFWLLVPAIVLYHLGLTGLARTYRNWRILRDTVPEIARDEFYIQYIAVNAESEGTGIGTRLMERARDLCIRVGKSKVVLDVREPNQRARVFFNSQGFREEPLITRRSDRVLGKGPTIRMEHDILAREMLNSALHPLTASNAHMPKG